MVNNTLLHNLFSWNTCHVKLWYVFGQFVEHSPSHTQRAVHLSEAFLHLHRLRHPFCSHKRPTRSTSWMLLEVWSNVVYIVHQSCQLLGEGSTGCGTTVWPQTWPPWKTALLTCCSRAASVGGILCTEDLFTNSFFLALFTSVRVLVWSYTSRANKRSVLGHHQ